MKMNKKSFTLVEIMIVVAIIALLAAIAIPNLTRTKVNANNATAQASLKSIAVALENYYSINNSYPASTSLLIGAAPPYLSKDYFTGTHNGFTYTATLAAYSYSVLTAPISSAQGTASYTITTGGVLVQNP